MPVDVDVERLVQSVASPTTPSPGGVVHPDWLCHLSSRRWSRSPALPSSEARSWHPCHPSSCRRVHLRPRRPRRGLPPPSATPAPTASPAPTPVAALRWTDQDIGSQPAVASIWRVGDWFVAAGPRSGFCDDDQRSDTAFVRSRDGHTWESMPAPARGMALETGTSAATPCGSSAGAVRRPTRSEGSGRHEMARRGSGCPM